jgi:hypothetical protein
MEAGLSVVQCSTMFEVTLKTVERWENLPNNSPKAVILFLKIYAGNLDFLGKAWHGFRLAPDCIVAPNGQFIYSYEAYALPYLWRAVDKERFMMVRALKQQHASKPDLSPSEESQVVVKFLKSSSG